MEKEYVKQTGLILKFFDSDYIAGHNSPLLGSIRMPSGDWRQYLPIGEPQYLYSTFDTMSCTTFSVLNNIETGCNFCKENGELSEAQLKKVEELGYLDENNQFNFSDRYTAIRSGTTKQGNYFQAVLDSAREKHGLIPEKDFGFGGTNWEEYHDPKNITPEMDAKAKEFKKIFKVSYEWTPVDNSLFEALRQASIACAIPANATHAVMLPKLDYIFDSYPPYLYPRNTVIAYALKIFVSVIPDKDPEPAPIRVLRYGMTGGDVSLLQQKLQTLGYFVYPYITDFFGTVTMKAVKKLQLEHGLVEDGIVGQKTYTMIEQLLKQKNDLVIIQKPTPNKTMGRSGYSPEAIVIHIMDGTLEGTDSWFSSSKSQVSSHYGIGRNGEIHQYVDEKDKAWHSGKVVKPSWSLLKPGVNPNLYTVGVEHEGYGGSVWTDKQKQSSARLIKKICTDWNIPIDRDHVIGHYQINGEKPNCPAVDKDIIQQLIELAKVV